MTLAKGSNAIINNFTKKHGKALKGRAEREDGIELLHKVAGTINHDDGCHFIEGETGRIDLISNLLEGTGYTLTEIGLCRLYSKLPVSEMHGPVTVISSHIDTHYGIKKPFSKQTSRKKLLGTYDNSITNAAVLKLMVDNRLPDNVAIAFTGDEEICSEGALNLADHLRINGVSARVIVTDVTYRGYKKKKSVAIENCCNSRGWTAEVKKEMTMCGINWIKKGNHEDDETCEYSRKDFECLSFCIPVKGEMHKDSGLKVRTKSFLEYIEALCIAAHVNSGS